MRKPITIWEDAILGKITYTEYGPGHGLTYYYLYPLRTPTAYNLKPVYKILWNNGFGSVQLDTGFGYKTFVPYS